MMIGEETRKSWEEALVAAFRLVESIQNDSTVEPLDDLLAQAESDHWYDVQIMIHMAELVRRILANESPFERLEAMEAVAELSGDPALLARALAARAHVHTRLNHDMEVGESALARAVALLDTGQGSPIMRPGAYILCAVGYNDRRLWTLADEMNACAQNEIEEMSVPHRFADIASMNRLVAVFNRAEAALALACQAFEAGHRDVADDLIANCPALPVELVPKTPPQWRRQTAAAWDLLSALAGHDRSLLDADDGPAEGRYEDWDGTDESRATDLYVELAKAVRLGDDGRADEAATIAAAAVEAAGTSRGLEAHISLGYHLVAQAPPANEGALRYARRLAERIWVDREDNTRAAQQRRWAEGVRLDSDHLTELAHTDPMTGLANRRGYERYCSDLTAGYEAAQVGLLVVDVNNFKMVNDTFGHAVGDQVLKGIARILEGSIRNGDLVTRVGGDEFVVLILGASADVVAGRAESIRRRVRDVSWGDIRPGLEVTISVGSAIGSSTQVEELVEIADRRMYDNKATGGRSVERMAV